FHLLVRVDLLSVRPPLSLSSTFISGAGGLSNSLSVFDPLLSGPVDRPHESRSLCPGLMLRGRGSVVSLGNYRGPGRPGKRNSSHHCAGLLRLSNWTALTRLGPI